MNGIAMTVGMSGRQDLFFLDQNFAMQQRFWDGTQWTNDWIQLGGVFNTVPVAVASVGKELTVATGTFSTTTSTQLEKAAVSGGTPAPAPAGTADATLKAAGAKGVIHGGSVSSAESEKLVHLNPGLFRDVQRLDVFGLGTDYAMYHKALLGAAANSPGGWENLGGIFTSAPAAIALDGQVHVFGLGTDYSMFRKVWNGSSWTTQWERLGGYFSSAPTVVSQGPGQFDVFARGADFTLRHRNFANGNWTNDWQNLGNSLASPPVAASWGPNRLDIFAIANADGGIIHRWWDGMIWNDWEHIAGTKNLVFTSMPAAASWAPGRMDVFAIGNDSALYHVWLSDGAWSQPESFGGSFASTPSVVAPAPNVLDVVAPGNDTNIYHKHWDGSSWTPNGLAQLGGHLRLPSRFVFSIDHLRVDTARSFNNDTDTGQCTLAIGNWPTTLTAPNWPLLTRTQSMGDLGGTAVKEGNTNLLNFGPITVELCESAIFNYTVVNAAGDPGTVSGFLTKQGVSLADSGVSTVVKDIGAGLGITTVEVAGAAAPVIGSLIAVLSGWLIQQLNSIINAKCDGVVAVEQAVLMGRALQQKAAHGFSTTTIHHGTDSATGCGANSVYEVTWSIKQV